MRSTRSVCATHGDRHQIPARPLRRTRRSVRFFVLAIAIGAIGVTVSAQHYSPEEPRTSVHDTQLAATVSSRLPQEKQVNSPCHEGNPFAGSCSTVSTVATIRKASICQYVMPGWLDFLCGPDPLSDGGQKDGDNPPPVATQPVAPPPVTPRPTQPLPTNMPRPSDQQPPSTMASPILTVVSWVSWFSYAMVVGSIIWLGLRMAITYRTGEGGGHLRVAGLLFLCCVMLTTAPSIVRAAL